LIREGLANRIAGRSGGVENSLQIAILSDLTEHLRQTEGLHVAGVVWSTESRWKRGQSRSPCLRPRILGTGLGDGPSCSDGTVAAQEAVRVARILSESTNSSM
jgi:hypothetical protein